eukprot:GEMP01049556.1.p1 GENE.GEMP01049556.1~~GEMP01049556.1.p1  ORF type:complete len:373 (+),score=78.35 GEMP01049556.1:79-1119(+)
MEHRKEKDAAALLGIPLTASPRAVECAYRKQSFLVHPDRHDNDPDTQAAMAQKFIKITKAKTLMMARASKNAVVLQTALTSRRESSSNSARSSVSTADVPTSSARLSHDPSSDFPVGEITDLAPQQVANSSCAAADSCANVVGIPNDADAILKGMRTKVDVTHNSDRRTSTRAYVGSPGRSIEHASPPKFPYVTITDDAAVPSTTMTITAETTKDPQTHSDKRTPQIPTALRRGAPYRYNSFGAALGDEAVGAEIPSPSYLRFRPSGDARCNPVTATTSPTSEGDMSPITIGSGAYASLLFHTADTAQSPRVRSPRAPPGAWQPKVNSAFRINVTPHAQYVRSVRA